MGHPVLRYPGAGRGSSSPGPGRRVTHQGTVSQPAPPRRRTPRRTCTATRVSHPKHSQLTRRIHRRLLISRRSRSAPYAALASHTRCSSGHHRARYRQLTHLACITSAHAGDLCGWLGLRRSMNKRQSSLPAPENLHKGSSHTPGALLAKRGRPRGSGSPAKRVGVTFRSLQGAVPGIYNQEYSCYEKFSESRPR